MQQYRIKGLLVAVLVTAVMGVRSVAGQQPARMVDYVDPSLLTTNEPKHSLPRPPAGDFAESTAVTEQFLRHATLTTTGDRWQQFESEYGIRRKEPSLFGRAVQTAKYQIDTMAFGAQEAARKLEFTYRVADTWPGGPESVPDTLRYLVPLYDTVANGQIKSVVTMHDPSTGKAFLGLEVVLAVGPRQ